MHLLLVFVVSVLVCQNGGHSAMSRSKFGLVPMESELNNNLEPLDKFKHRKHFRNFVSILQKLPPTATHVPGTPVELTCEAMGYPAPSIQWMWNNTPLEIPLETNEIHNNGVKDLARVVSTIIISIPSDEEQDLYTCIAVSGQKTAKSSTTVYTIHKNTELVERYRLFPMQPRIVYYYKFYLSNIGSKVLLPCLTRAHPRAVVYWRNSLGEIVNWRSGRMKVLNSGALLINNLHWSDMGEYTCIAVNSYGKDKATTFVYAAKAG